jgi:hypothetical protein
MVQGMLSMCHSATAVAQIPSDRWQHVIDLRCLLVKQFRQHRRYHPHSPEKQEAQAVDRSPIAVAQKTIEDPQIKWIYQSEEDQLCGRSHHKCWPKHRKHTWRKLQTHFLAPEVDANRCFFGTKTTHDDLNLR